MTLPLHSDPIAEATLTPENVKILPFPRVKDIPALPSNSLLLEFTDGRIGVPKVLFELLVEKGIVTGEADGVREGEVEDEDDEHRAVIIEADQEPEPEPEPELEPAVPEKDIGPPLPTEEENKKRTKALQYLARKAELKAARAALADEEFALADVERTMNDDLIRLKDLLDAVPVLEKQTADVALRLAEAEKALSKSEFLLETRQLTLLAHLRTVFPIVRHSDDLYDIRGLSIPRDMSSDDEHISGALGFLCHLLSMTSKYLGVPLRYKILCNSSRSAVQDGSAVYPLFKARVDRERFDRGTLLLERDVDSLLSARGIVLPPSPNGPPHMLAKVDELFSQTLSPQNREKVIMKEERRKTAMTLEKMFL